MPGLNENVVEVAAAELLFQARYRLAEGRDLTPAAAPSERPTGTAAILAGQTTAAIRRLNPALPDSEIQQVVRALLNPARPTVIENNRWFHDLLTEGVPVEYKDVATGETRGGRARLIDFDDPASNDFLVVRQL